VPLDEDSDPTNPGVVGDGLADKWERAMAARWRSQYGPNVFYPQDGRRYFSMDDDKERRSPGGIGSGYTAQFEIGDGHTALEEYRGYILDGGGFNGLGGNGHPGGHIRLNPARKELLVEVDQGIPLQQVPNNDIPAILDGAAKVFSSESFFGNANRGAGIYMYYVLDQSLAIPKAQVDTLNKIATKLHTTRSTTLRSDFLHLLFINAGCMNASDPNGLASVPALSIGAPTLPLTARGAVLATTEMDSEYPAGKYPKRLDVFATTVAHELTHLLIETSGVPEFDGEEHTQDANGDMVNDDPDDRSCLMHHIPGIESLEISSVRFFPIVQQQLRTRTSEGLVP
jgi:hypothetical protein